MLEAEKSRGVQYIGILIDLRLVSMQPLRDACVTIHVQICVTILVCVRHRAGMEDFAPQRDLIKGGEHCLNKDGDWNEQHDVGREMWGQASGWSGSGFLRH